MKLSDLKVGDRVVAQSKTDGGGGFWSSEKEYLARTERALVLRNHSHDTDNTYRFEDYWFWRIEKIEDSL